MRSRLLPLAMVLPVLGACSGADSGADSSSSTVAPTAQASPSRDGPDLTPASLGGQAWAAKYGFGGIWVQVDPPVDKVVKVDTETSQVVLEIDGGRNVAMSDDAVWVALGSDVQKIDPATGDTMLVIESTASYVAVGAGSVWTPTELGLERFDAESGDPLAIIPIDAEELTEVAATDDAIWVSSKSDGAVFRVDPATDAVVAAIRTGSGAHGLAVDDSGVWVTNYEQNTVSRIDPDTNTVAATVPDVGSGTGILAAAGAIWVSTRGIGISRIDPATNQATLVAELPSWNYGIAHHEGELWVTDVEGQSLTKLAVPAPKP